MPFSIHVSRLDQIASPSWVSTARRQASVEIGGKGERSSDGLSLTGPILARVRRADRLSYRRGERVGIGLRRRRRAWRCTAHPKRSQIIQGKSAPRADEARAGESWQPPLDDAALGSSPIGLVSPLGPVGVAMF